MAVIAVFLVGIVAAALAAPPVLAVQALTTRREVAPMVRGSLERSCVLAAGAISAAALTAQMSLIADGALLWFAAAGPLILGAAPWFAGELLSGPSQDPLAALSASVAFAHFAGWAGLVAVLATSHSPALALAAGSTCAAACAAATYLGVRGAPRER